MQIIDLFSTEIRLPIGDLRHFSFGDLDLWIQARAGEWRVANRHLAEEDHQPAADALPPPDDLPWIRWVTGHTGGTFSLCPIMPDRPVIVRPETPVCVMPGETTYFYLGIPLWLQVSILPGPITLGDYASVPLSSSWFGQPTDGELCYAMRTRAHVDPALLSWRLHRAICQIQVRNTASEVLSFKRLCLRCQFLSVFKAKDRFWTNSVRLTHRGGDEWSRVSYGAAPAEEAGSSLLVSPAREKARRGFLARSFNLGI